MPTGQFGKYRGRNIDAAVIKMSGKVQAKSVLESGDVTYLLVKVEGGEHKLVPDKKSGLTLEIFTNTERAELVPEHLVDDVASFFESLDEADAASKYEEGAGDGEE